MPNDVELKSIEGVEIFSVGTWNGDTYSERDLDEMVKAFNDTGMTCRPALKLGHDDNQAILQADGYPAAGWVGKLYRDGKKLLADFIDIPEKIYQLIERGAYRNVSSEIYWEADVDGKKYDRMLAAVALLGADMPAVSNLSDIMAMYALPDDFSKKYAYAKLKDSPTIKTYKFQREGSGMTEAEKKLQAELEAAQAKLKEAETQLTAQKETQEKLEAEKTELAQFKADAEKKLAETEAKAKESALDAEVEKFSNEVKTSPAMKPYIRELLGEEKKSYSLNKKEFSKIELLKETLKLHAEALKLNTKETTIEGDKIDQGVVSVEELQKYAKEHNCTEGDAYRQLYRGKLKTNKGGK